MSAVNSLLLGTIVGTTEETPIPRALRPSAGTGDFVTNFQVCPGPSNATIRSGILGSFDYGDFTSLVYRTGVLRFAWADNSNGTNDNPDWPTNQTMDIYTCTVKY